MLGAEGGSEAEVAATGQGIQRVPALMGYRGGMAQQRHAAPLQCSAQAGVFQKAINPELHGLDGMLPQRSNPSEV
jgi:hypothetical protein